jgi:ABC-2 type transport system ATP-binding protein
MSEHSLPIEARGLVKRYDDLTAVAGIDITARAGTCLGLLGPNGAGKTTSIEILEGLMPADAGVVRILGSAWHDDARGIRQRIGVQLQETRLPEKLCVDEVLRLFRSFYTEGRSPDEVLDVVGLNEKRRSRVVNLSGGQRQRLALGCALVNRPEVLFLDEPTTGLDPQARRRVWEIVEDFKAAGGTVLLTTHFMDEAERLADELLIIDHGRTIAEGTPSAIVDSLGAESVIEFTLEGGAALEKDPDPHRDADHRREQAYASLPGVVSVRGNGAVTELAVRDSRRVLPLLLDHVRASGNTIATLHIHRPTLEDVFVTLTGRSLRDE